MVSRDDRTVRMRPWGEDPAGDSWADRWRDIPFRREGCQHQETVCVRCLDSWQADWEVEMA